MFFSPSSLNSRVPFIMDIGYSRQYNYPRKRAEFWTLGPDNNERL